MSIFGSSILGIRPLFSIRRVGRASWVLDSHQGLGTQLQKGSSGWEPLKDTERQRLDAQASRDGVIPVQFVAVSVFILLLGALCKVTFAHIVYPPFFPPFLGTTSLAEEKHWRQTVSQQSGNEEHFSYASQHGNFCSQQAWPPSHHQRRKLPTALQQLLAPFPRHPSATSSVHSLHKQQPARPRDTGQRHQENVRHNPVESQELLSLWRCGFLALFCLVLYFTFL